MGCMSCRWMGLGRCAGFLAGNREASAHIVDRNFCGAPKRRTSVAGCRADLEAVKMTCVANIIDRQVDLSAVQAQLQA